MKRIFSSAAALVLAACAVAVERAPEVRPLVDAEWLHDNLEVVIPLDIRQTDPARHSSTDMCRGPYIRRTVRVPGG